MRTLVVDTAGKRPVQVGYEIYDELVRLGIAYEGRRVYPGYNGRQIAQTLLNRARLEVFDLEGRKLDAMGYLVHVV